MLPPPMSPKITLKKEKEKKKEKKERGERKEEPGKKKNECTLSFDFFGDSV